ncbi:MAG: hypothetical protein HC884_13290 [Chloroflexaceae bacterium]|nr:hypothetical protein [Chloroflexaceae bacterium]
MPDPLRFRSQVLVQWAYTPEEWETIQAERLKDFNEASTVALGCLPLLLGLVGVTVGAAVGAADGVLQAFVSGSIGGGAGVGVGLALAVLVRGVNLLAAIHERSKPPASVVLAETELFYEGDFFRSNGITRTIEKVSLEQEAGDQTTLLTIELRRSSCLKAISRQPTEETWAIPVPPRLVAQVRAVLPRIRTGE